MAKYIDADTLIKRVKDLPTWWADGGGYYGGAMKYPEGMFEPEDVISIIEDIPAADVTPVRHGRWTIAKDDYYGLNIVKCSVCHEEWCFEERDDVFDLNYHYCPNCGAYMMGENNGKCE